MAQYRTGYIKITQGSQVVTGVATEWSSEVSPGDLLMVLDRPGVYAVDQVLSDTEIRLVHPYQGASADVAEYAISRDWTTVLGLPLVSRDDVMTSELWNEAMRIVDSGFSESRLATVEAIAANSGAGLGRSLRGAAQNTKLGQSFTSGQAAEHVTVSFWTTGLYGSVPDGSSLWVELYSVAGGAVGAMVPGGKSRAAPVAGASKYTFQLPGVDLTSGGTYLFAVCADYPIDVSHHVAIEMSDIGFTGGQSYSWDGAAWSSQSGDLRFEVDLKIARA